MPSRIGLPPHNGHLEHQYESRPDCLSHPDDPEVSTRSQKVPLTPHRPHQKLTDNRQASIIVRLALPLLSIGFTVYAMAIIIDRHFAQPIRSLLASFDILLATFISNATVLISLLQDRGYKKTKYKHGTERDGFHVKGTQKGVGEGVGRVRQERWGSDEDLMRGSEGDDASLGKKADGTIVSVESIGLQDLKSQSSVRGERDRTRDKGLPEVPGKVKLKEIRVATTWDIRVEEGEA